MKTISLLSLLSLMLLLVISPGCKKESVNDDQEKIGKEVAMSEKMFDDDAMMSDEMMMADNGYKSTDGWQHPYRPCATITIDTIANPHVLTIDFGPENCLCNDGNIRRGKIITSFTGPRYMPGSVRTTTYENYFVNDNQIMGTTIVTNNGLNNSGNLNWTITIDKTIAYTTGDTLHFSGERNREWIEGIATPLQWIDDVYLITGNMSFERSNGNTRTVTITTPLRREMNCHHFVSGVEEIIRNGDTTIILDFGDGTCDDSATITVNGVTRTIRI